MRDGQHNQPDEKTNAKWEFIFLLPLGNCITCPPIPVKPAISRTSTPRGEFFELVRRLGGRHADEWDREIEEEA